MTLKEKMESCQGEHNHIPEVTKMVFKPIESAPSETSVLCYGPVSIHLQGDLRNEDYYVASKDSNGKWHMFYATFQHGFKVEPTHWAEIPSTEGLV